MKNIKNITALFLIMLLAATSIKAQGWVIPEEAKNEANPLEINDETIEKGSELYAKSCQSCHGELGKGNFLPLAPPPGDLGAEAFLTANTSGDMYFKITNGMAAMPGFAKSLSNDDRWAIVAYLNPVKGEVTELAEGEKIVYSAVKVDLTANDEKKKISATLSGKDQAGNRVKVKGAKVAIYAKRYFGNLLIGKGKTNASGSFSVEFPTDLPGDAEGLVNVIAIAKEYKQETKTDVNWGVAVHHKNRTEEASLWGTNSKAPWWMILLYVGIAGSIWFFIIRIIIRIAKLKKLGKKGHVS